MLKNEIVDISSVGYLVESLLLHKRISSSHTNASNTVPTSTVDLSCSVDTPTDNSNALPTTLFYA
jgi:hypothetical protein